MKSALNALHWFAYLLAVPILLAVLLVAGFLCIQTASSLWPVFSWRLLAWTVGEFVVAAYALQGIVAGFERLPGAGLLKRPLGSFFRHG